MFWISPHDSSTVNSHFTHFSPFFVSFFMQPPVFLQKTNATISPYRTISSLLVSDFLPIILGIIISQCSLCCIITAWISQSLKLQGSFIAPFTIKPGNNDRIKIAFSFVVNGLSVFLFFIGSLVLRLQYMPVTMDSPSLILKINFLSFARYMFPQIPGTSCKLVTDGDEASHFYTIHFKILHLLCVPSKENDLQWEKIHSAERKAGNGVKHIFFTLWKAFLFN